MNQAIAQTRAFGFNDNRLPYVPDLADAYGIDNVRWRVLVDVIFPNAKKIESIIMALTYCKARNLDIFKRPVHIVPMWSSAVGGLIDTVWPGISEIRTTAFRTGQFAGISAAEFGPTIEEKFGEKGEKTVRFPEWCQVTVTRMLNGTACSFASPKVYWRESYAVEKRGSTVPNEMWARRPSGQLEKCTEAAALRRAFPEEVGNEYTAEEMEGQILHMDRPTLTPPTPPTPPKPPLAIVKPAAPAVPPAQPAKPVQQASALDYDAIMDRYRAAVSAAKDDDALDNAYLQIVDPIRDNAPPGFIEQANMLDDARRGELAI